MWVDCGGKVTERPGTSSSCERSVRFSLRACCEVLKAAPRIARDYLLACFPRSDLLRFFFGKSREDEVRIICFVCQRLGFVDGQPQELLVRINGLAELIQVALFHFGEAVDAHQK